MTKNLITIGLILSITTNIFSANRQERIVEAVVALHSAALIENPEVKPHLIKMHQKYDGDNSFRRTKHSKSKKRFSSPNKRVRKSKIFQRRDTSK